MSRKVYWNLLVVGALGMFVSLFAGCKKKPSCDLLYERMKKCAENFKGDKGKFVDQCKKEKDKDAELKAAIACTKFSDCKKFKKCIQEGAKKARAKKLEDELNKALASGNLKDAAETCDMEEDDLTDALKKKCAEIYSKHYDALKAKVTKERDSGADYDVGACTDLEELAKKLGAPKVKEVEGLCAEAQVAEDVAKTIKAAKEQMGKAKPSMPLDCSTTLDALKRAKTQTKWIQEKKKAVVDACYAKLGKVYLEKWFAGKPQFCLDTDVDEIYKAFKKYNIQDAGLKAAIQKITPLCKKQFAKLDAELSKGK